MRNHCRKLASLVEHHEARATSAESSLKFFQQRRKSAARQSEEYVEYVRVPRRGKSYLRNVPNVLLLYLLTQHQGYALVYLIVDNSDIKS